MNSRNIKSKVNSELYDKYGEFYGYKGAIVSRQFNIYLKKQIKGIGHE